MNRATAPSLLIACALALALPLAARAQGAPSSAPAAESAAAPADGRVDANAVVDTGVDTSTAPINAASAAAADHADEAAFQQWADAERQRIAAGRAAANARYEQDRRDCWQRFAVNACLDDARDHRRATTDALRHDELTLNAQQRNRRTAARLDELTRKQADSAARDASAAAAAASAASAPSPATKARAPR